MIPLLIDTYSLSNSHTQYYEYIFNLYSRGVFKTKAGKVEKALKAAGFKVLTRQLHCDHICICSC